MPFNKDAPEAEVSAASLLAALDAAVATNNAKRKMFEEVRVIDNDIEAQKKYILYTNMEIARMQRDVEQAENRVETLADLRKAKAEAAEKMPEADETEARKKLAESEDLNRKVRENVHWRSLCDDVGALEKDSEELSGKLDTIIADQQAALAKAEWPVPDLSIDDEGVLYKGLPFAQASKSVRTLTSVRIGMALNPRLKLLVCQDGNDLDSESLLALEKLLDESGYQMILELVTRGADDEARCAVIIEDGTGTQVGKEAA
jgi:hypothetical protein